MRLSLPNQECILFCTRILFGYSTFRTENGIIFRTACGVHNRLSKEPQELGNYLQMVFDRPDTQWDLICGRRDLYRQVAIHCGQMGRTRGGSNSPTTGRYKRRAVEKEEWARNVTGHVHWCCDGNFLDVAIEVLLPNCESWNEPSCVDIVDARVLVLALVVPPPPPPPPPP